MASPIASLVRACLLGLAFAANLAAGAVLPVEMRCNAGESFEAMLAAERWQAYDDGRVVVTPSDPVCWVRLAPATAAGGALLFTGSWVDVALYRADGALIGKALRGADGFASFSTSRQIFFPAAAAARYARVTLVPGWGMAAEATVEDANTQAFAPSQRSDDLNLALVAILFTSAFFLAIFALVLRYLNYALLAGFLLLTGCARLLEQGQMFTIIAHGAWSWPLWAALWPLVNAALALTSSAIGRFHLFSPAAHRASIGVALLFLPLCLAWPMYPEWSDQINAVLNIPLYAVLLVGSAIGARRGDAACRVLLASHLFGAAVWLPGVASRFVDLSGWSYLGSPLAGGMAVAADLAIPLLLCVALARRQLELQRRTAAFQLAAIAQASRDVLTGLLNRDGLLRYGAELAEAGRPYAVVVLNVDRFRAVNETLGGPLADLLLQAVGTRLAAFEGAVVARLHADQFCVIWPQVAALDSLRERVGADSAVPVTIDGQRVDLPLSAGVTVSFDGRDPMAVLLRNAEIALDVARTRHMPWLMYQSALEHGRRADLGLLSELDRAVGQGELRMFLQPKVRLADGAVPSAEALVRWQHPERGLVPPFEFVPFAVRTGRIAALTDWMLAQAMALTAKLRAEGAPLQISVNMSARDLTRPGLVAQLIAMTRASGAVAQDIRLEITESEAMDDPGGALEAMHAICAAGFSLSIDDFGTGYSSLVYLQQMPVVELKIDRAFVSKVMPDSEAAVLLRSTIELGHRLGLAVVAEGPESAGEWAMVTELGCDYAQGWHAAPAMQVEQFLWWRSANVPFASAAGN